MDTIFLDIHDNLSLEGIANLYKIYKWSPRLDLNQPPSPYQDAALPHELRGGNNLNFWWFCFRMSRLNFIQFSNDEISGSFDN